MKLMKRMSPRKRRRGARGAGRGEGGGALESPDTLCDELCSFTLCITGEQCVCVCVCVYVCLFVCV